MSHKTIFLIVRLPSLWLDDLYRGEGFRSKGAGVALMSHLAQEAKNNYCTHLAWTADNRNTRTISFYHHLGAKIVEQNGNVCFFSGYRNRSISIIYLLEDRYSFATGRAKLGTVERFLRHEFT